MSAPLEKEHLKTIQSTLLIYFTGVRRGELVSRQHIVSATLPTALFDATDIALAQYALLILSNGKMYTEIANLRVDENTIEFG